MADKPNRGKPENLRPFKPGVSGNPKGAPKGRRFKTVIKEFMEMIAIITNDDADRQLVEILERKIGRKIQNRELLVAKQIFKAAKGDTFAFNALADREEGRPPQETKNFNVGATYTDYLDDLARKGGDESD